MVRYRIASLLLILALLFSFVSCRADNSTSKDSSENTADNYEELEYQKFTEERGKKLTTAYVNETYGSYDFDGYEFRIMGISPAEHYVNFISDTASEIWYEEDNADVQVHSVFTRNILTEDLLNVTIVPIFAGTSYDIYDLCQSTIKAGGDDYDICYNAQFKSLLLAMESYFYNFYDIPTFNPKNEWWDQQYVDTFTMKNNLLFTITGDALILDEMAGEVLFYNTQVLEDHSLPDPTKYVDDGVWTIDRMMEMAEAVTNDSDGDGIMTRDDNWGLTDNINALIHFVEGCNIHMTKIGENGLPEVIIESEEFSNAVQYVFERLIQSPATLLGGEDHYPDVMIDDRGLFHYDQVGVIFRLRDMESNFGLLPMPKLNEQQPKYTSVVNGIWCSTFSVPITAQHLDEIGTILDVFGGFSTDTVDNAMDEVLLGSKLIREKRSRDMLRYVVESREYDWAKDIKWGYPIYNLLLTQTESETFTLASSMKRNIKLIKNELRKFTIKYK